MLSLGKGLIKFVLSKDCVKLKSILVRSGSALPSLGAPTLLNIKLT